MGRRLVTGPLGFFGFCKGISVPSPMNDDMSAPSATLWLMMSAATMFCCRGLVQNRAHAGTMLNKRTLRCFQRMTTVGECPFSDYNDNACTKHFADFGYPDGEPRILIIL